MTSTFCKKKNWIRKKVYFFLSHRDSKSKKDKKYDIWLTQNANLINNYSTLNPNFNSEIKEKE